MRIYEVNDNYFSQWSPQMAYWLGFLAADGSVSDKNNSLTLILKESDKCAIEQFKKDLEFNGVVHTYTNKAKGKSYLSCGVTITSAQIKQDLSCFNIIPRKSLLCCSFISTIPEKYKKPFIVRFFDGDGHIGEVTKKSRSPIEFLGSKNDCEQIINVFSFKKFRLVPENEKGLYALIINSFEEKEKFLSFYQSFSYKNFVLPRKLERVYKIILWDFERKKKNNLKIKRTNKKYCLICGKEKKSCSSLYCIECGQKIQQKVDRPSKEVLQEETKKYSFLYLGRKYRVSDNTVRKWCKRYNIPYRKKDII